MKLLTRYNQVNIISTTVIFIVTGLIYYQTISWILTNQKDKSLAVEEDEIFEYVHLNNKLPQIFQSEDQQITFKEVKNDSVKRQFIDTEYLKKWDNNNFHKHHHKHKNHNEKEPGRELISFIKVGDKLYQIQIIESKVETEDLIRIIFIITFVVTLLLILVLLLTNRLILGRIWKPFYNIVGQIKQFSIAEPKEIQQPETDIEEFSELGTAVTLMATKAKNDYTNLKTFTENASHELLTPIAVINSKLDTLLQTENFSEVQSKILNDLYGAVSRLNKLNNSLLLLVKIENHLLDKSQRINLKALIVETANQFEEIIVDKELKLKQALNEKEIVANHYLIEILLNNLFTNAIRHNYKGGEIQIALNAENLIIKNTGIDEPLDDSIFVRFNKSANSEGSGLGLTISRQICENFKFTLNYGFENGFHCFVINF